MQMRTAAVVAILLFITTAAAGYNMSGTGEPAFLHDIGPQNDRADQPAAAAITAVVVLILFYHGLQKYRPDSNRS